MRYNISKKFNIWEYIYYHFTMFYMKHESKTGIEDNKTSGAYVIGTLIAFNIISFVFIISALTFKRTPTLENILLTFIFIIILFCVFYSIYFFKKNHKFIFKKYENDNLKVKQNRKNYVILYILLSVVLLFLSVYIGRENWMIKN